MHGTAYCSACDRPVPVMLRRADADVSTRDAASELVCLDYGARCTGALCPMFSFQGQEPAPPRGASKRAGGRAATSPGGPAAEHVAGMARWIPAPRAD